MGLKHELRSTPFRAWLASAVAFALAVLLAVALSGCAAVGGALGGLASGFVDGLRGQPTRVALQDATVWTQPRVMTNKGFEGYTHFVAKMSEGAEAEIYCPAGKLADRCMKLVPGQHLKAIKGGWIEVRPPGDAFMETLAVERATTYPEARMQGMVHEGVTSTSGPRPAIYLQKLKARPPSFAPNPND